MNSSDFTEYDLQNANRKIWMFAKEGDLQGIQNIIIAMMRAGWLWEVNFNWQDHLVGHTALMRAAMEGHANICKYLIDNGADVNVLAKNGSSALINAAASGNDEIVFYLIDHGANVNVIAKGTNETAMIKAAEMGRIESVKYLFVHGAGIELKNENGMTPLILAAENGHSETVYYLVENAADINARNKFGATALIVAAKKGHYDIVRILVEHGANMNVRHRHGATALMEACRKGHSEVVRFLVERGADVNFPHKDGGTALTISVERGFLDIVKYIVELSGGEMSRSMYVKQSQGSTEQDDFAEEMDPDIVINESASDHGLDSAFPKAAGSRENSNLHYRPYEKSRRVDINVQNKRGATSLMIATVLGYADIAKYLVDKGADLNIRSKIGETVLMIACAVPDRLEIVRYLIEKDANINIQDENGESALMKTFHTGNIEVIKYLIERGANVNLQNKRLDTVLHLFAANHAKFSLQTIWFIVEHGSDLKLLPESMQIDLLLRAISENDLYVLDYYIARGYDMEAQNQDGMSPLMVAAEKRLLEIMRRLVSLGINIDLQNKLGQTALMLAAKEGNNKIIEFLLDSGADELLQDQEGRTALCYTIELRRQDSFELLLRLKPYQTAATRGSLPQLNVSPNSPNPNPSNAAAINKRIYWQTKLRSNKDCEYFVNVCDCLSSALRAARNIKTCNIHLLGNTMAGKSILFKWLRTFLRPKTMLKKMFPSMKTSFALDSQDDRTRGIDTVSMISKNTMNYVLHDYSGNEMMHVTYPPILSRDSSMYVIVLPLWNARTDTYVKKQDLISQLLYWMRIIYSVKRAKTNVVSSKEKSSSVTTATTSGIPLLIVFNRFTSNTKAECSDQHCVDLYNEVMTEVKKVFKINALDGLLGKDVDFVLQSFEPLILDCAKRQDSYIFYQKLKALSQFCPLNHFKIPMIVDYVMKNYHLLSSSLKLVVESSVFDSALKDMLPGFPFNTKAYNTLDSTPFQTLLLDILRKLCRLALKERFFVCELPNNSKSSHAQDKIIVKPSLLFSGIIGEMLLQLQRSSIFATSATTSETALLASAQQLGEDLKLEREQLYQLLNNVKVSKFSKEHRHLTLKEYLQRNSVSPDELLVDLNVAISLPSTAQLGAPTRSGEAGSIFQSTVVTKASSSLHKSKSGHQFSSNSSGTTNEPKVWLFPFIPFSMPKASYLIKATDYDRIFHRAFALPHSDKMMFVPGFFSKLFSFIYSQLSHDYAELQFWSDGMIMKTRSDSSSKNTGHRIFKIRPFLDTTGIIGSSIGSSNSEKTLLPSSPSAIFSTIHSSPVFCFMVSVASFGSQNQDYVQQAMNTIREFMSTQMWGIRLKEYSVDSDSAGSLRVQAEVREIEENMRALASNKSRIEFGQFMLDIKD